MIIIEVYVAERPTEDVIVELPVKKKAEKNGIHMAIFLLSSVINTYACVLLVILCIATFDIFNIRM